jgi:hypothetical protein
MRAAHKVRSARSLNVHVRPERQVPEFSLRGATNRRAEQGAFAMKVKTKVKAGAVQINHNAKARRGAKALLASKVKTGIRAGGRPYEPKSK